MSRHFQPREFACPHCGDIHVAHDLMDRLEALRARGGGRPIRIVSGYRCPVHNRQVGGAAHSQHLLGNAADIPPGHARLADARAVGFTGVGIASGWAVHVDVREGAFTTWQY